MHMLSCGNSIAVDLLTWNEREFLAASGLTRYACNLRMALGGSVLLFLRRSRSAKSIPVVVNRSSAADLPDCNRVLLHIRGTPVSGLLAPSVPLPFQSFGFPRKLHPPPMSPLLPRRYRTDETCMENSGFVWKRTGGRTGCQLSID